MTEIKKENISPKNTLSIPFNNWLINNIDKFKSKVDKIIWTTTKPSKTNLRKKLENIDAYSHIFIWIPKRYKDLINSFDKITLDKLSKEWLKITEKQLLIYINVSEKLWTYDLYKFIKNFPKKFLKESNNYNIEDYKDSIIYNNNFENVPEHYVSVYHYTSWIYINDIIKKWWLIPLAELWKDDIYYKWINTLSKENIDLAFDKVAPKWFSRTNSIYAYPKIQDWPTMWNWNIILEIKVDPNKVLVSNAEYFTEARIKWLWFWEKYYWDQAITLAEYNKLSDDNKEKLFTFAEIIIPNGVKLDYISIIQ